MKISDLFPTPEQLASVQSVERKLLERKQNGTLLGATLAIAGAVLQVVAIASRVIHLPPGQTLSWAELEKTLHGPEIIGLVAIAVGAAIYFSVRYTGVLLKESQEPFRYTFWIEPFARVTGTVEAPFSSAPDEIPALLHYDLMERLNTRIGRLSLLPTPGDAAQDARFSAHIHIQGNYAVREDNEGNWMLHVMPCVRIGPASKPLTLATPVKYTLESDAGGKEAEAGRLLTPGQYSHLIERVYSSVATEIYRQIKTDVAGKICLFPTGYLRAVARYHEAKDFENSNTLDSYDQALDLYRAAKDEFDVNPRHRLVNVRLGERGIVWWWSRNWLDAEAKTRLGYSRCLIYRRVVSALSGRNQNPLFEIRRELATARRRIEQCYNSVMPRSELKFPQEPAVTEKQSAQLGYTAAMANLAFPSDAPLRRKAELYARFREELCETYAVSALGYAHLLDTRQAQRFLSVAEALQPREDRNRALVLLAKAEIEANLLQKLAFLRQTVAVAPTLEIARYRLAVYSDLQARTFDEINFLSVTAANREYEEVLRINPGNIASLIGQGYLWWLVNNRKLANQKFKVGEELQAAVSPTFVGDLKYGQARVAAEDAAELLERVEQELQGAKDAEKKDALATEVTTQIAEAGRLIHVAYRCYSEATAADPAVATCYSASSRVVNTYYQFIAPAMLARYRSFAERMQRVRSIAEEVNRRGYETELSMEMVDLVVSYAWNDYGNAELNYSLLHDVVGSKSAHLENAVEALLSASQLSSRNVVARYNLYVAYSWRGQRDDEQKQIECLDEVVERFPNWLEAVRTRGVVHGQQAQQRVVRLTRERDQLAAAIKDAKAKEPAAGSDTASAGQAVSVVDRPTEKPNDLNVQLMAKQAELDRAREQRNSDAEQSLQRMLANSRLLPLMEPLKVSQQDAKLGDLLSDRKIDWLRFNDEEAFALRAWAEVLATWDDDPEAVWASCMLCRHIRSHYYPEDFSAVLTLLTDLMAYQRRERGSDSKTDAERDQVVSRWRDEAINALRWSVDRDCEWDPGSQLALYWRRLYLNLISDDYSTRGEYEKAIETYRDASKKYGADAEVYYRLALALEQKERQLQQQNQTLTQEERQEEIQALRKAHELAPENEVYRAQLETREAQDWVAQYAVKDVVNGVRKLFPITVEVGRGLLSYVTENDGLAPRLQQQLKEIRTSIEKNMGIILPEVNFRDNLALPEDEYRILAREVPIDAGFLDKAARDKVLEIGKNPPQSIWDPLAAHIQVAGLGHLAELHGSEDVLAALKKRANMDEGYEKAQNDPEWLNLFTQSIKALLNECVPVTDLNSILPVFTKKQKEGRNLFAIIEEIRSSPEIRPRLLGNDFRSGYSFLRLSDGFEAEVHECIDRRLPEPILDAGPERLLRWSAALRDELTKRLDRSNALVVAPEIRPFIHQIVQTQFRFVPVLSTREILPGLVKADTPEIGFAA